MRTHHRVGDIVTITGFHGRWRITRTHTAPDGSPHITATSLNAYPRVDITITATRAHNAHQE